MAYDRDHECDIDLDGGTGCITQPAIFSTWLSHPDDLPTLTLEAVRFGANKVNREWLVGWLGEAEVRRIEAHYVPEIWNPERRDMMEYEG